MGLIEGIIVLIVLIVLIVAAIFLYKRFNKNRQGGQPCTSNSQCVTGNCGRQGGGNSQLVCCGQGETLYYDADDALYYCVSNQGYLTPGSICRLDRQCLGPDSSKFGNCAGNNLGANDGYCEECSSNSDCSNGACGRNYDGNNNPRVCCQSGKTCPVTDDWCSGLEDGEACLHDCQCKSSKGCSSATNTCIPDSGSPVNTACVSNSDCTNNACGHIGDSDSPYVCCPTNFVNTADGRQYCSIQGSSTGYIPSTTDTSASGNPGACRADWQCQSGYCCGNGNGIRNGICTDQDNDTCTQYKNNR